MFGKKEDTTIIDLDAVEKVSISDIFESADVVQLETNDDCLISSISNVIFGNDRYHILDLKLQTVFCFDSNGKFLFPFYREDYLTEEQKNTIKLNNPEIDNPFWVKYNFKT